MNDQALG